VGDETLGRSGYLVPEPRIQPGVDDVGEARELFLSLIPEYAKKALPALAKQCLPAMRTVLEDQRRYAQFPDCRYAKGIGDTAKRERYARWKRRFQRAEEKLLRSEKRLTQCMDGWAIDHHLSLILGTTLSVPVLSVPAWIRRQARITLEFWAGAGGGPKLESWAFISVYDTERPTAQQGSETRKQFAVRAKNVARRHGLQRPPRVALNHFIWAVQFQVEGRTIMQISAGAEHTRQRNPKLDPIAEIGMTSENIRVAIHRVLERVGLTPRRDRPGPKPSGHNKSTSPC
jgi:hypothetical protein